MKPSLLNLPDYKPKQSSKVPIYLDKRLLISLVYGLFVVLQTLSLWRQGKDYTRLFINVIFFGSAFYYYYQRRYQLKFPSQPGFQVIGASLFGLVVFKLLTLSSGESSFWFLASPMMFFGITLLAAGFYGFKQFRRFWCVFLFLWATFLRTPWLTRTSSWLTVFSAKISSFFLWYLGFNSSTKGSLVYVNDGIIDIYNGCTLTPLLFISIDLLVILYAFYPISRRRRDIVIACLLACGLSFALSIVRLAIMALVVNDTPRFDFWHGSQGSNLFMTICLVGCGLYAINRMPARQSESVLITEPLPPLANPEWLVKGFLLAIAALLGFLILLPDGGAKRLASFSFPETIPLAAWQVVGSEPLSVAEMGYFLELEAEQPIVDLPRQVERAQREQNGHNILMSGRRYEVKQGDVTSQITLSYVLNSDSKFPDLEDKDFSKSNYRQSLRQAGKSEPDVPYLLVEGENRTHLVSCLTSRGKAVVTPHALYRFDRIRHLLSNLQEIYQWLTSQRLLTDRRCLWVHLSEESVGTADANHRLVKLWQELQGYWAQRFPPL